MIPRMKRHNHTDCIPIGDNPKGDLRRLHYDSEGNQARRLSEIWICDGCFKVFKIKLEEIDTSV